MRYVLFFAALLFSFPSFSAAGSNYGQADCGAPVSCSAYSGLMAGDPKIAALISQAEFCVRNNFGISSQGKLFQPEMGLDYKRCLKTNPDFKLTERSNMIPQCCLAERGDDKCVLHCDLYLGR